MSVTVKNLVVNQLLVNQQGEMNYLLRESDIPITTAITTLVDQLHFTYNSKANKAFAEFKSETVASFEQRLIDWLQEDESYLLLCSDATQMLTTTLNNYTLTESGYLVLCHYQQMTTEYLLICLLPTKAHTSISDGLDLSFDQHLDLSKMQLALRINLSNYKQRDASRYIDFVQGRVGRKVADFFLEFLNATICIDAKEQSATLLNNVEQYLNTHPLDMAEKSEVRKEVVSYCKEQHDHGEDVVIQELSNHISVADELNFQQFCTQNSPELPSEFPIDKKSIQQFSKFSGYGDGVSISFDKKHLANRVIYDPNSNSLLIKDIPPNLKDQLDRFFASPEAH